MKRCLIRDRRIGMVAQPQTGRHGPQLDARPPRRDTAGTQPVCAPVKLSCFQHPP
nr:hypothetical protein [Klebsiella variicola]